MLDDPPFIYLFAALVIAAYVLVALFLGAVREERPDKFKEICGPNEMLSTAVGPFYLGLNYILPLDYETWDLSRTTTWIGRVLFLVVVMWLLLILWVLVSLLRLQI